MSQNIFLDDDLNKLMIEIPNSNTNISNDEIKFDHNIDYIYNPVIPISETNKNFNLSSFSDFLEPSPINSSSQFSQYSSNLSSSPRPSNSSYSSNSSNSSNSPTSSKFLDEPHLPISNPFDFYVERKSSQMSNSYEYNEPNKNINKSDYDDHKSEKEKLLNYYRSSFADDFLNNEFQDVNEFEKKDHNNGDNNTKYLEKNNKKLKYQPVDSKILHVKKAKNDVNVYLYPIWDNLFGENITFPEFRSLSMIQLMSIINFINDYDESYWFFRGKKYVLGCFCKTENQTTDYNFILLTSTFDCIDSTFENFKLAEGINDNVVNEFYQITSMWVHERKKRMMKLK